MYSLEGSPCTKFNKYGSQTALSQTIVQMKQCTFQDQEQDQEHEFEMAHAADKGVDLL